MPWLPILRGIFGALVAMSGLEVQLDDVVYSAELLTLVRSSDLVHSRNRLTPTAWKVVIWSKYITICSVLHYQHVLMVRLEWMRKDDYEATSAHGDGSSGINGTEGDAAIDGSDSLRELTDKSARPTFSTDAALRCNPANDGFGAGSSTKPEGRPGTSYKGTSGGVTLPAGGSVGG